MRIFVFNYVVIFLKYLGFRVVDFEIKDLYSFFNIEDGLNLVWYWKI